MTREVKEAVKRKHETWYRLKKKESKGEYRRVCKELKKLIFKAKNNFEKSLAAKSKKEPKLVHAYVRSKLIVKDSVRALRDEMGDLVIDKGEIADILNKHFHSIFGKEPDTESPEFNKRTETKFCIDDILRTLSLISITKKIKGLSDSKSPGFHKRWSNEILNRESTVIQ